MHHPEERPSRCSASSVCAMLGLGFRDGASRARGGPGRHPRDTHRSRMATGASGFSGKNSRLERFYDEGNCRNRNSS